MEPHLGIKSEDLQEIAGMLTSLLADEFILSLQTRKAHWNIESHEFYYLHKFFDEQYGQIDQFIDDMAERIRMLGHFVPATLHEFLKLTHLTELSEQSNDSEGHIRSLLASHTSMIINLRKHIHHIDSLNDTGTSDFLTGVLKAHEKITWMLRAHLN